MLKIGDVPHAKSLLNALLEDYEEETRAHCDFEKVKRRIRSGSDTRPTRSAVLGEFLGSDATQSKWGRMAGNVRRAYAGSKGGRTFYTYLLLDMDVLDSDPSFRTFVRSITYVGKGTEQRARDHADKALAVAADELKFQSRKIQKVRNLLDSTRGSIGILRSNIGVNSDESLAWECAMMRAMGLQCLTNAKLELLPKVNKTNGSDPAYGSKKKGGEAELDG